MSILNILKNLVTILAYYVIMIPGGILGFLIFADLFFTDWSEGFVANYLTYWGNFLDVWFSPFITTEITCRSNLSGENVIIRLLGIPFVNEGIFAAQVGISDWRSEGGLYIEGTYTGGGDYYDVLVQTSRFEQSAVLDLRRGFFDYPGFFESSHCEKGLIGFRRTFL